MRVVRTFIVGERRRCQLDAARQVRFGLARAVDIYISKVFGVLRINSCPGVCRRCEASTKSSASIGMRARAEGVPIDSAVYSLRICAVDPNSRDKARCVFCHSAVNHLGRA